ncbi:MAG: helicase HerA domain-containing protein, partial [Vulcanisaeta sp.]
MLSPSEISSVAARFGDVIGHVTISETIMVGSENYEILIEIPHENYVKMPIRVGDFIGIITLTGYVVLGRITEIRRSHAAGISGRTPIFNVPMDYTGLETPAVVMIEPLTECLIEDYGTSNCDPSPVHSPIDPLSIAFKPSGDTIARLLALPSDGVIVGQLYSGGRAMDVDVRIPIHTLYEHTLIVGTTGSGKTTLLKNLALALVDLVKESTVITLDLQGDYLHLVLPPDKDVKPRLFNPLNEITIIVPITRTYLEEYGNKIRDFADDYVKIKNKSDTIMNVNNSKLFGEAVAYALLREFIERSYGGAEIRDVRPEFDTHGDNIRIKRVSAIINIDNVSFRLNLIPWALSFVNVYRELPRLFPIFSYRVSIVFDKIISLAMDLIGRRDLDCGERLSRRSNEERCAGMFDRQRMRRSSITGNERDSQQPDFDAVMINTDCIELAANCMRLAWQQRENIIRGLNMIGGVGIMDVK